MYWGLMFVCYVVCGIVTLILPGALDKSNLFI